MPALAAILASLARQRGVHGCLVVSESDGIVIDSIMRVGIDVSALAALSAALHRKARRSARAAGLGTVTFLRLEAKAGLLCVAGRGDLLLVTLAEGGANAGRIRVEMVKCVGTLQ